jgi:DNA polymerase III epsilon subunit-like protein
MKAFLDFEASSLSTRSYPVEVAWVFEDGRSEEHLITLAETWTDWDEASQAVHGITRDELATAGEPVSAVAARMIEMLSGHEVFASAPSWDGKWLSVLLRQADLPRHALRLRDTDDAIRATATELLSAVLTPAGLATEVDRILRDANAAKGAHPRHRALADALAERETWLRSKAAATALHRDLASHLLFPPRR